MIYTTLIDAASLRAALTEPGADDRIVLLDCRFDLSDTGAGRQAFMTAHIPGARYADLNLDLAAPVSEAGRHPLPSPDTLTRFFTSIGIGNDTQVIAYDAANGSFAARAWWLLRWLGHSSVAVLNGGFNAWVADSGAVESGVPASAVRSGIHFAVKLRPESVSNADAVRRTLGNPRRLLVDARAPERFAGMVEPLDRIAGHVPGAVNHPFSANLGTEGRFLPSSELQRRWRKLLDGRASDDVIVMCGSGVTACHHLLAMELAGLPGAKLYAGSLERMDTRPRTARGPRQPLVAP